MLFRRSGERSAAPDRGGGRDSPKDVVSSLFGDWYAPLLRYACRATGRLETAEDLVQEAFTELYRALIGGKAVENPKAWTLCVVRRRIIDQQREQARHGGPILSLSEVGEVAEPRPTEAYPAWEEDSISRLLAPLSAREEEVLLLRVKGLKYRQIASALEISTNSVKTLLARGIRKMQRAAGNTIQTGSRSKHDGDIPTETLQ
jgi:RNA polymerase sigma-70 factor (ECF subfamily)